MKLQEAMENSNGVDAVVGRCGKEQWKERKQKRRLKKKRQLGHACTSKA
jgi:hypothetical protein